MMHLARVSCCCNAAVRLPAVPQCAHPPPRADRTWCLWLGVTQVRAYKIFNSRKVYININRLSKTGVLEK